MLKTTMYDLKILRRLKNALMDAGKNICNF